MNKKQLLRALYDHYNVQLKSLDNVDDVRESVLGAFMTDDNCIYLRKDSGVFTSLHELVHYLHFNTDSRHMEAIGVVGAELIADWVTKLIFKHYWGEEHLSNYVLLRIAKYIIHITTEGNDLMLTSINEVITRFTKEIISTIQELGYEVA